MTTLFDLGKKTKFKFWNDPGHGWMEVSTAELAKAGLSLKDITVFSYRKGDRLFLEEDVDATTFIHAWRAKVGEIEFDERHTNNDSFIRRLPGVH